MVPTKPNASWTTTRKSPRPRPSNSLTRNSCLREGAYAMARRMPKTADLARKRVVTLTHDEASRKNIPTAELQSVMKQEQQSPLRVAYERRNRDLDPQLVWRGKDDQDWSDLVVQAPPLYIQEKGHPKALIDDLLRRTRESRPGAGEATPALHGHSNGTPEGDDKNRL